MIKKLFQDRGNSISVIFLFLSLISLLIMTFFMFLNNMYNIFPKSMPSGQHVNSNILNSIETGTRDFLFIYASVFFISFYLVPRLTGRTFFGLKLATGIATLGFVVTSVSLFLSYKSKNNFGFVSNLSIVLMILLILFTIFCIISFKMRSEKSLFVSGYFLLASFISLIAGSYSMGIGLKTTADLMIVSSFFTSSQIYMGTGFASLSIILFLATKGIGGILENRPLASITLWGYLFLFPWVGLQFYFGTFLPNWIENTSIFMSIGLIVPLIAFLSNILKTIQSSKEKNGLTYRFLNNSIFLFTLGNLLIIVGSLPSIIPLISFTTWDTAIKLAFIFSFASGLLGLYTYSIPKLIGKEFVENTISYILYGIGSAVVVISLAINGIVSGYLWTAGANAGNFTSFGEGYQILWKAISPFHSIATLGSLLIFTSLLIFSINTLRSVTSGSIVPQEILVGVKENE